MDVYAGLPRSGLQYLFYRISEESVTTTQCSRDPVSLSSFMASTRARLVRGYSKKEKDDQGSKTLGYEWTIGQVETQV